MPGYYALIMLVSSSLDVHLKLGIFTWSTKYKIIIIFSGHQNLNYYNYTFSQEENWNV